MVESEKLPKTQNQAFAARVVKRSLTFRRFEFSGSIWQVSF